MKRGNLMTASTNANPAQQFQNAATLHQRGDFEAAEAIYRELIKKKHDLANTTNLLGILLLQTRRFAEAINCFKQAVDAGNRDSDVLYNSGFCHAELGNFADAIAAYKQCLAVNPQHKSTWFNLGLALASEGLGDDAIDAFKTDFELTDRLEALVEISTQYLKKFDWDNTEKYAAAVLQRQSTEEVALYNLATARLGRLVGSEIPDLKIVEQALRLGKSMIASNPQSARGHTICGDALQLIGEIDLALQHYEKSLQIDPSSAHVHANTGVIYLMKGQLQQGWREIAWRGEYGKKLYGMDVNSYSRCPAPEWDGVIHPGKHILVSSEQGIGDQIMQAQLVLELLEGGMRVTLTCTSKLVSLLQRSIPDATIVANNQPLSDTTLQAFDYKIPQLELVGKMRPTLDSFKKHGPYLKPEPALVEHFKRKYASDDGKLNIGIAWKSTSATAGKGKSSKLTQWQPLITTSDCRFFSVQYGDVQDDVAQAQAASGITIQVDDEFNPFDDVEKAAAQIAALDLVISVSNAAVHLAGAMGKPCWVMLHTMPLWHWFNHGNTSVWYDSVRLYRQQQLEGWSPVIDRIRNDLAALFEPEETAVTSMSARTAEEKNTKVISEEYRRQQQKLHENPNYGTMSIQFAPMIKQLAEQLKVKSLSDYGAGKQNLIKTLNSQFNFNIDYFPYDPAFPEYGPPQPAELVCCIDVLEHIEPELLQNVINDLKKITVKFGFFSIHTGPAVKILSDGRNAHLIQKPSSWWLPRLCEHFEIELLNKTPGGFFVLVSPRQVVQQ